jgi:hypothetical protein
MPYFILCFLLSMLFSANAKMKNCEKKLRRGVTYSQIKPTGGTEKIKLRFAPFELSAQQQDEFNKFKSQQIKLYGEAFGLMKYKDQVCQYFFGSYKSMELPQGHPIVNRLLENCPLKALENIKLAPGPRPDCAPAAVHCQPFVDSTEPHPMDKIACGRIL